jgi:hypothetical protein
MHPRVNLPEQIEPSAHYSFRTDLKVNGWAWVAVATSFIGEVLLLPVHPDWPAVVRAAIALVPLAASLLWARSFVSWTRGMDQLQRRVTISASLFAAAATLFVVGTVHLLRLGGVYQGRFEVTAAYVLIWVLTCCYLVGRRIFNRQFR